MAIISINNGYFATKVKTDTKEFMFESKIQDTLDEFDYSTVELNGKSVVVGKGANDISLDKTTSEVQKACIMMALKKSGMSNVNVISSLPVNSYINKIAREEYKEWLMGIGGINEVKVYMEGAAAVLSDLNWYRNKLVALLDIGGLTINAAIFDDGKLVSNTATSLNLGTIILENRIKTAMQQSDLINVPSYQLKYLLEGDNKVASNVMREYIQEIKQELRKMEYPTKINYRCTGGGAVKFKTIFGGYFNAYVSEDAIWENVRGLHLMGKVVWEA